MTSRVQSYANSRTTVSPTVERATVAPAKPKAAGNGWDRSSYLPPKDSPLPTDALSRAKAVFSISEDKSKLEARQIGAFFDRHPSQGASQIVFFHSYWAQHQTFQKVPLQAFLYSRTRPVDDVGQPKNALWKNYADLVQAGASAQEIERAFFKAHIAEFKQIIRTPEFKQLYALSTPKYRKVVEAYLDTLVQSEQALKRREDPTQTARWLFPRTVKWLNKHGVKDNGFMATWQGVRDTAKVKDPLNKQFWGAFRSIVKNVALNTTAERKEPTRVFVSLTASEAEKLKEMTGIPFRAGRQELSEEMLANAKVSEPERRQNPSGPPRSYPLRMSDFLAEDKLHPGSFVAGPDGVMNAKEVQGVVRHVQSLVRSQLIEDFFKKYPVPHAGVHLYSANMLSMNGAYAASEMAHTLANAIMPVDNDGKPKNASWQAYVDASVSHQRTGSPSKQTLESLWWKAHMEDFDIVDTPRFQSLLTDFWRQAEKDPGLKPLAIYTKAMVWGRQNFERDRHLRSEDSAFGNFINHFSRTLLKEGSFPFWKHDLKEAKRWLTGRSQPLIDDRGLPTDRALFERSVKGIGMMTGLHETVSRGVSQMVRDTDDRMKAETMVDLAAILSPEQLKQVDPRIVDFYRNPEAFDVRVGVDIEGGFLDKLILGKITPLLSGQSKIPDRIEGFENFSMESQLYKDEQGGTHWDRYVVVDGERKPLFLAKFETEGRQIKETFSVRGQTVTLYFDVVPYQGGVKLTVDRKKSSRLAAESDIVFTVVPKGDQLITTGRFEDPTNTVGQTFTMRMSPKRAA